MQNETNLTNNGFPLKAPPLYGVISPSDKEERKMNIHETDDYASVNIKQLCSPLRKFFK